MFKNPGKLMVLFILLLLSLVACGTGEAPAGEETAAEEPPAPLRATANLQATEGNSAQGTVTFEEENGSVHITAHITGLQPGEHGFHIHETGDCSAPDASSAGGHFNPTGAPHGGPDSAEHHAGDLGNITADESGAAHVDVTVDFITLGPGQTSVIGKAVVVHAGADDLESQPSGAAGARVACGVIESEGSAASETEGY